ncbi:MAG: ABC transporter permease [Actinomycetota bacterium]|nr:ABC transporter permease [Actinomycetota bacterium]
MKLAWRELRRRPGRFVTATAILTLIASLLMLLGGLLDGLLNGATSAVLAQPGELIVYSSGSEESFPRSRVDAAMIETVRGIDGVEDTGGLGVVQLGARVPGQGERDLLDVVVIGYELPPDDVPEPPDDGSVYADSTLEAEGLEKGMTIELGQARIPVEVAGFIDRDLQYSGQGTLWASPSTWREALNANRPGSVLSEGAFQAVVVDTGSADPDAVAGRIDDATEDATITLTTVDASEAIGGVKEQRSTFNQIIGVTVLIAVVVVALFFVLLTVERMAMYGVLKAIGARSRTLFAGVLLQALVVCAIAWAIGAALAVVLDLVIPVGSIPFTITPVRLAVSAVLLVVAAALGSAFSLRRVLRIDPAEAIG